MSRFVRCLLLASVAAGLTSGCQDAPIAPTTPTTPGTTTAPSAPATTTAPTAPTYRNCDAVRAAGVAPLHRGDPGYRDQLDRDRDGVACDEPA